MLYFEEEVYTLSISVKHYISFLSILPCPGNACALNSSWEKCIKTKVETHFKVQDVKIQGSPGCCRSYLHWNYFHFFLYSYHYELLCALYMNFSVIGVELRLCLFYLVQWVINFLSHFVATAAIPEVGLGGTTMFMVDFFYFSPEAVTHSFSTALCLT